MRAKSQHRLQAERLRAEEGLSYNEIAARTGLSKSTLSHWLRDIPLQPEHEFNLKERMRANRAGLAARAWSTNRQRYLQARNAAYYAGADVLSRLPDDVGVEELALAMLYLGEGSKSGNRVQLANTNVNILRYFTKTLVRLYEIDTDRLSFRLNLVAIARPQEDAFRIWWSEQLGYTIDQFLKTQFDARSTATELTGDYHGVCTVTYHDTYLQQRLLGLADSYLKSRGSSSGPRKYNDRDLPC